MKYAIDKITGNRVAILREADTRKNADGSDVCVVIRHPDGSQQIQFKTMLTSIKGK